MALVIVGQSSSRGQGLVKCEGSLAIFPWLLPSLLGLAFLFPPSPTLASTNSTHIVNMSHPSSIEPTKEPATQSEHVDISEDLKEKDVGHSDVLVNPDLMHDAFDGENREHEMGVWEAVQTYPWACFWATLMCFTIVSALALPRGLSDAQKKLGICGKDLG